MRCEGSAYVGRLSSILEYPIGALSLTRRLHHLHGGPITWPETRPGECPETFEGKMNFGPAVPLPEIAAALEIIICGLIVVAAFVAGWMARGSCNG